MKKLTVLLVGLIVVALALPATAQVKVSGFAQAQLVVSEGETAVSSAPYFTAKRARLVAKGDLGDKVGVFAQLEIATSLINVLDLLMDYDLAPIGKIAIGRRTVPFGLQNPVSPYNLHTINYAQVVSNLIGTGGRDLGLYISGKYDIVDYVIGYINGADVTGVVNNVYLTNNRDNNDEKDIVARVGVSVPGVAGLGAGVSIYNGKTGTAKTTRNRTGIDAKYEKDAIYAQLEYITGEDGTTKKNGYYLEAGYKVTSLLQPMIRYDFYDPNSDVSDNENTITAIGVNVYLGKNAKVQIFSETKTEKPTDTKNDVLAVQTAVKF